MNKTEQDLRVPLFNALLTSPHRDLDKLYPIHESIKKQDPLFYQQLASWYWDKGEIRDQKEIFIVGLSTSDFEGHRDIGLALLRKLPPYQVRRVMDFIRNSIVPGKECGLGKNIPRSMKTEITRYLREREADNDKFDSVVVAARNHLKRMYAILRIEPSTRAQQILFDDKPPKDSKLYALKLIAQEKAPAKQAKLIIEHKIPYRIASTVIKAITPTVLVALINAMSPQELINNISSLQKRGAFDNPDVKKLIEAKLEKAKKSKRVSAYKAKEAAKIANVSEDVKEKLSDVTEAQIKKTKIKMPTALLVDKCITANTWLFSEEGLIQVKELLPKHFNHYSEIKLDCNLASRSGNADAKCLYANGKKEVFQVKTKKGYTLTATTNHPILTLDTNLMELCWREIGNIERGTLVPIQRNFVSYDRKEFNLDWFEPKKPYCSTEKNPKYPLKTSPKLGRFLGYLVAEGWISRYPAWFLMTNSDEEILYDFQKLTLELFNLQTKKIIQERRTMLKIASAGLNKFLQEIGFNFGRSAEKEVPWTILRSSQDTQKEFLRALFEGDGGLSHPDTKTIILTSASEQLLETVQQMLLPFGIISRIKWSPSYALNGKKKVRDYWRLSISGFDTERFEKYIGFISETKKERLNKRIKEHPSKTWETRLDNIPNIGKFLANNLPKEEIKKIREKFPKNNYFDNSDNIGCPYWALKKVNKIIDLSKFDGIKEILREQFFFDRIKNIKSWGLQQTFDLSVPSQEAFVASGFISHNSLSLSNAIELGKNIAAMLSAICESDLWVYAFDSMAYYIPHPPCLAYQSASLTNWENAFKGIKAGGNTSCGVAIAKMIRDKRRVEQIIVVTDGGENEPPFFVDAFKQYRTALGVEPNICFVKVDGAQYSEHIEMECKRQGIVFDSFRFSGDYYALPNLLPLVSKPSKLDLLEEIMNWPLPKRLLE